MLLLIGVWCCFSGGGPVSHPPGILIAEEPVQGPVPAGRVFWQSEGTNFRALASYSIKSRVLHTERYRWDAMSDIAPLDLGVGWGMMSTKPMPAAAISPIPGVTSTGRGRVKVSRSRPPPAAWSICTCSPPTTGCATACSVSGAASFSTPRGILWRSRAPAWGLGTSSLSRLDTGDGACEIMWVESLTVLP